MKKLSFLEFQNLTLSYLNPKLNFPSVFSYDWEITGPGNYFFKILFEDNDIISSFFLRGCVALCDGFDKEVYSGRLSFYVSIFDGRLMLNVYYKYE